MGAPDTDWYDYWYIGSRNSIIARITSPAIFRGWTVGIVGVSNHPWVSHVGTRGGGYDSLHVANSCIWQWLLPHYRRYRVLPGGKPIRRDRCASSPIAAGGANDIVARLMGQWLSERLGQPFVIENRPGGGSNIGTEAVVRAPPDGYTLLAGHSGERDQRDALRKTQLQFHPRHRAGRGHHPHVQVVVVHPSVPAKTVPEFIAYAKANPGKLSMASGGNGTSPSVRRAVQDDDRRRHGSRALSRRRASAHRPARRTGAGLIRPGVRSIEHVKAGKLRAFAVTTATRSEALPDVPTVSEFVPGYRSESAGSASARQEHCR